MEGIINLLKNSGMTSHDCITAVRRMLGEKRVGHIGTLDPMACGVLPLCIGKATRLAEYSLNHRKQYRAEMVMGITSDTQDITGEIISRKPASGITEEKFSDALKKFLGPIEQVAPGFSAVKHHGKKLYELARKGLTVPKKTRNVTIFDLSLFRFYPSETNPRAIIDVVCSKGTYIRTLCSSIGDHLGPGAVMSFLVRTASGPFSLENTVTIDEVERCIDSGDYSFLMPMDIMVNHLPLVNLEPSGVKYIRNGAAVNSRYFSVSEEIPDNSLVRLQQGGDFVGIGVFSRTSDSPGFLKPKKVLI